MIFKDRFDAGEKLAQALKKYKDKDAVILAIPRGGLEIGNVVAKKLKLPLDVVLTKKIGHPLHKEYAIGAVSLEGSIVSDPNIPKDMVDEEIKRLQSDLKKKYKLYVGKRKPVDIKDKIVIIVDDGIATGRTMLVTIDLVKHHNPKKVIVAIPVGAPDSIETLKERVEVVCLSAPFGFFAVGQFYANFDQVSDESAIELLNDANK